MRDFTEQNLIAIRVARWWYIQDHRTNLSYEMRKEQEKQNRFDPPAEY